jgi:hypothetical protein
VSLTETEANISPFINGAGTGYFNYLISRKTRHHGLFYDFGIFVEVGLSGASRRWPASTRQLSAKARISSIEYRTHRGPNRTQANRPVACHVLMVRLHTPRDCAACRAVKYVVLTSTCMGTPKKHARNTHCASINGAGKRQLNCSFSYKTRHSGVFCNFGIFVETRSRVGIASLAGSGDSYRGCRKKLRRRPPTSCGRW